MNNDVMRRWFLSVAAQWNGTDGVTLDSLPSFAYQIVGDDGVLVDYNEAMMWMTHGGIAGALGRTMREFSGRDISLWMLTVSRLNLAMVYQGIRHLKSYDATYRVTTLIWPEPDGLVRLYVCPMERLDADAVEMEPVPVRVSAAVVKGGDT